MWGKSSTMPWKGLRVGSTANNTGKKTDPDSDIPPARHSEHTPRQLHAVGDLPPRLSESIIKDSITNEINGITTGKSDSNETVQKGRLNHGTRQPSTKRNRFSLMKFRHASDPQLSTTYQQNEPPPVPSLLPPPTIITTSPTTKVPPSQSTEEKHVPKLSPHKHNTEQSQTNRNEDSVQNPETTLSNTTTPRPTSSASSTAHPPLKGPHISFEEPGRLSTASLRSGGPRPQGDGTQSGSVLYPGARVSDSSRSDASSGEHGVQPPSTKKAHSSSSIFRFPRLKKSRGTLFPLPVKISPPEQHPMRDQTPPEKPNTQQHDQMAPLPSPSQSSRALSSAAGSPGPPLLRKNSAASAHSRSSLSPKTSVRRSHRARSSTMGSLPDIADESYQSSPENGLNKASTYSTARKSFSDLFNLSNRAKLIEPAGTPEGSPNAGPPFTPASKPNSFSMARELSAYPPREEDDTPGSYLTRLEEAAHRGAIATILSQSPDEFYSVALRKYMRGFSFFGDPMDMAIRKLLMEAELPKETQQIDRVIQAFSNRYHECNPGIFSSADQAYFIAFSLLILHTDVFNKNNKRKMQKQDYVKNTRGEGVYDEILECFYDNICYTPFIHVEDDINLSGRLLAPKSRNPLTKVTSSDHIMRSSRDPIDPYAIILEGKLDSLRPNLKNVMELEDVYSCSCTNTGPAPNMDELHHKFYKSCILQIVSARSRPDAFLSQFSNSHPVESQPGLVDIRVAKVGVLWRKDPKKKKARSPWQEWGAVLTGSQLYLFRDIQWVKSLISQFESRQKHGRRHAVTFKPPVHDFKPDAIMSTDNAVVLLDSSYKKHKNAFLLIRHGGFDEVFLATSETEMNDWMTIINYAAAYRSTNVRMGGMVGANYEAQPPAQTPRTDSIVSEVSDTPPADTKIDPRLLEEVFAARRELMAKRIDEANEKLSSSQKHLDDLLRNARHLQHLTPIHARARDHSILAAGRLSAKIKWARLEHWRTKCHRDILVLDLANEERLRAHNDTSDKPSLSEGIAASISDHPSNTEAPINIIAPNSPKSDRASSYRSPSSPVLSGRVSSPELSLHSPISPPRRESVQKSSTSSELHNQAITDSKSESKDSSTPLPPTIRRDSSVPRQSSIASSLSRLELASPSDTSNQATPTPSIMDDEEQRFLRESGILPPDAHLTSSKSPETVGSSDAGKKDEQQLEVQPGEHRSKVRRSLQRTLREAHHIPHHHRSRKGRDSTTSGTTTDDGQKLGENSGLTRKTGSFTVHGKKASVITFGTEWQNMSTEQRLKQRKLPPSEDSRASDMCALDDGADSVVSGSANGKRPFSVRSASTTTAMSLRNADGTPGQPEVPLPVPEAPNESNLNHEQIDSNHSDYAPSAVPEASKALKATEPAPSTQKSDVATQDKNIENISPDQAITRVDSDPVSDKPPSPQKAN